MCAQGHMFCGGIPVPDWSLIAIFFPCGGKGFSPSFMELGERQTKITTEAESALPPSSQLDNGEVNLR